MLIVILLTDNYPELPPTVQHARSLPPLLNCGLGPNTGRYAFKDDWGQVGVYLMLNCGG